MLIPLISFTLMMNTNKLKIGMLMRKAIFFNKNGSAKSETAFARANQKTSVKACAIAKTLETKLISKTINSSLTFFTCNDVGLLRMYQMLFASSLFTTPTQSLIRH